MGLGVPPCVSAMLSPDLEEGKAMPGVVGSAVNVNLGDLGEGKGDVVVVGLVQEELGDTRRKIWHPDPASGGAGKVDSFVRREPADYGPEGGGKTWYPL